MSEVRKRKVHSAEFKAKVGMEAVRVVKTLNEYATGVGGRASIADPFSGQELSVPEITGQRRPAAFSSEH